MRLNLFKTLTPVSGFLFHTVPPSERLDRSDAAFVDVLHTAGLWIGSDEVVSDSIAVANLIKQFTLVHYDSRIVV